MTSIKIGTTSIAKGKSVTINLPVAKLYTHNELTMPVRVISSYSDGPVLFLSAALHGDEINGVEIIRRVLKILSPKKIKGTLIAVPVVNTHGFISRSRYLPDRRDLNRSFPGSNTGPLASRIAYLFMNEIVSKCTYGIDLHSAAIHRTNLPQVRVFLKDKKAKDLALAFKAPVVLDSGLIDGSLRREVYKRKIPIIVYESGEALRYNEIGIRVGVNGVLSAMHHLGMLHKKPNIKKINSYIAKSSEWIRAVDSGLFRTRKKLGSVVKKGDVLGYIADPFGKNESTVTSSLNGIIIGTTQIPLINKGEALYHIATFKKTKSVKEEMNNFQEELGEKSIDSNSNL